MSQKTPSSAPSSSRNHESDPSTEGQHEFRGPEGEAPWYRREPWLALCLAAFLPLLLGTMSPKDWQLPLFLLSGGAFTASLVLLMRAGNTPR